MSHANWLISASWFALAGAALMLFGIFSNHDNLHDWRFHPWRALGDYATGAIVGALSGITLSVLINGGTWLAIAYIKWLGVQP